MKEIYIKDFQDITSQIIKHENETSYGEPQAFIELPNERTLEIVHEEYGLGKSEQYYSWRVHCSESEFDNDIYHGTLGIIDQTTSSDLSEEICNILLDWAYRVANS